MSSASFSRWLTERAGSLDEIENAHSRVGGSERGRRYATQQINHAYAVLLSSQFQGFCRDLHTECADLIAQSVGSPGLEAVVLDALVRDRKLDRGNPNPGNLGADFGRLGIRFWDEVKRSDRRNEARRAALEQLCAWRNAIAHQDFLPVGGGVLRLQQVRRWRAACVSLAQAFDRVAETYLRTLLARQPW